MQAIKTKYMGPTDYRGARIKASAEPGSVTVPYDHALNPEQNHAAACLALAEKLDWDWGEWIGGSLDSGDFYAWVADDGHSSAEDMLERARGSHDRLERRRPRRR